ncbi:MAG: tetratricopeptide repeat protein [Verrucomicrobiales bacterium]
MAMNRVERLGKAAGVALLVVAFIAADLVPDVQAQESQGGANEKALRYFQVLQKRPSPGYLFDRFYNAWLDTSTLADLEEFLRETVASDGKTANRLLLAFYFVKQGENVRALEQFKEALEKDPGRAEAWYQKALVEQRTLNFDNAIQDLERAISSKPATDLARDILQLQGRLYARNGNPEKAKEVWQKLLKENGSDEDLQEDLIELQMSEGLYDDAIATAEGLLKVTKDPYLAVLRQLRIGDIRQRSGKRNLALEAYDLALTKVGNGTWIEKEIFAQIDQVFRRDDDIAGLKEHFVKLKEGNTGRIGIQRKLVDILAELGEKDAATAAFSEILALTPGDRAIREDYVDTLVRLELADKAVEQLEALIGLYPEDGELLIKLAELQDSIGKKTEAGATVQRYLEASDKSEYAHLRAARLLEQYELTDAAEAMHQKLAVAFPDSEGARDAYASFLHRTDRKEEAVSIWLEG